MLTLLVVAAALGMQQGPPGAPPGAPPGIPFGAFNPPDGIYDSVYTGALQNLTPKDAIPTLEAARRAHARIIIRLVPNRRRFQNPDGSFSPALWEQFVDRFRGIDFQPYIADGTIVGHYLFDEPHDPRNWNGAPVPYADIEAVARYSKQLWPGMPTIIRSHPGFLRGNPNRWAALDAAWAQFGSGQGKGGKARKGGVEEYLRENVADAQALGLALVVGLNVLDGGDGSSGIEGTKPGDYNMTADEVRRYGAVLAASPYVCAVISWKYDPAYFDRPDVRGAMLDVSRIAARHPPTPCTRH